MAVSDERIQQILANPRESLNVELEDWLDPSQPHGAAKIVKSAFALRNRDGGELLIGFDDETLRPNTASAPNNVRAIFHLDIIQGLLSRYASEPFAIEVLFADIDGIDFPVIVVPKGVVSPVVMKRHLIDGKETLLKEDDVYFRTLRTNGTPSSAKIKAGDWPDLLRICFDNREADIGRFLRRHLGNDVAARLFGMTDISTTSPPTLQERAKAIQTDGESKLAEALQRRNNPAAIEASKNLGSWSVALVIDPPLDARDSDQAFLNTLNSSNPDYTGWPIWLDSSGFSERSCRPIKREGAWQALIDSLSTTQHLDFQRMSASGEFYLWRILQDDLTPKVRPRSAFDPTLAIYRVIEALLVGLSFARALGAAENGSLGFLFKWSGLADRVIESWADRNVHFSDGRQAYDDVVETFVQLPTDSAPSSVGLYAKQATDKLLGAFDGLALRRERYDELVERMLARRW